MTFPKNSQYLVKFSPVTTAGNFDILEAHFTEGEPFSFHVPLGTGSHMANAMNAILGCPQKISPELYRNCDPCPHCKGQKGEWENNPQLLEGLTWHVCMMCGGMGSKEVTLRGKVA